MVRSQGDRPLAAVAGETLDESVVEHIAARDELAPEAARAAALDTLRLVAASREARAALPGEPSDELAPERVTHLLRSARARLWLEEGFEPTTRLEDVPEDAFGRVMGRVVHPNIHWACQIIVMPTEGQAPTGFGDVADDPKWREQALAVMEPVRRRLAEGVVTGREETCDVIRQLVALHRPERGDLGLKLKYEAGGFDLDACAEKDEDGTCIKPSLVTEWSDHVRKAKVGAFTEPFFTRFGLHVVYLREVLEARERDDPGTDERLRELAHPRWQAQQFMDYLAKLRQERTVRVAAGVGNADEAGGAAP